jgi:hypothetical protein
VYSDCVIVVIFVVDEQINDDLGEEDEGRFPDDVPLL